MARFPRMRTFLLAAAVGLLLTLGLKPQTPARGIPRALGPVLILTAHPDDECMFFAPTIRALLHQGYELIGLCLSSGDFDGLGSVREQELYASYGELGVQAVHILDHPSLRDDINLEWDPIVVAEAVGTFLAHHEAHTILTFDRMGVSGHPNHISLFKGAAHLVVQHPHIRLLTLTTFPLAIKYSGPMIPLYYYFASILRPQNDTVYISGPHSYLTALKAMRQHSSQLVWFRWLYVLFSCYMWVNVSVWF